ncbi:MAG: hypothetical protein ACOCQE_04760 [Halanaerobium sp.]
MSKQESTNSSPDQQDFQTTQARQTSKDKDLSQFIEDEEKEFTEKDFESENKSGGISGIESSEATKMLTSFIAPNIPAEKRNEFLQNYPPMVENILNFVDFEEMTEGANVKEMPTWIRILILVVSLGGFTFVTVKKYQPEQTYEDQEEQKQKDEGWRE